MGLRIDVDVVTAVLLADGWHEVDNESFTTTPARFDSDEDSPSWPEAFSFRDTDGRQLYGPLSSIIAVNTGRIPRGDVKDGDDS